MLSRAIRGACVTAGLKFSVLMSSAHVCQQYHRVFSGGLVLTQDRKSGSAEIFYFLFFNLLKHFKDEKAITVNVMREKK